MNSLKHAAKLLVCFLLIVGFALLPTDRTSGGTTHAVIVGVGTHQSPAVADLPLATPSVRLIRESLVDGCRTPAENVRVYSDQQASYLPSKANIERGIAEAASEARPGDNLVIYFVGHGYRSPEGDAFLLPLDADPRDPEGTMIALSWLTETLVDSQAVQSVVILDSCYDGVAKSVETLSPASAESLARQIVAGVDGSAICSVASAANGQRSLATGAKENPLSLFAYWFSKALYGYADHNEDRRLDLREIHDFVAVNVERTSVMHVTDVIAQRPTLILNRGAGSAQVASIRPKEVRDVLGDVAELLSWELYSDQSVQRVAIMPFTFIESNTQEASNGGFAGLGRSCSAETGKAVSRYFRARQRPVTTLVGRDLGDVLTQLNFAVDDLQNERRMQELARKAGVDAIIAGSIQPNRDNELKLQLTAFNAKGRRVGSEVQGLAIASPNTMGMLGISGDTRPMVSEIERLESEYVPPIDSPVVPLTIDEQADVMISGRIRDMAEATHPLQDPSFPYRLWLAVDGERQPTEYHGNEATVRVSRNKPFAIHVENESGEPVVMRLLVDGFNTLPQAGEAMPLVHLDEARPWVLDPSQQYQFPGFATSTGTGKDKLREFLVVDATLSLAARRQYTQQLGLITAAFYQAVPSRRGVGVVPGREIQAALRERAGVAPGQILGIVHLRYHE